MKPPPPDFARLKAALAEATEAIQTEHRSKSDPNLHHEWAKFGYQLYALAIDAQRFEKRFQGLTP